MTTDYQALREKVLEDLEERISRQEVLEAELEGVKQEIQGLQTISAGLDAYLGESGGGAGSPPIGITDAIRETLSYRIAMKPTTVRDKLREEGFPIDEYSQPMAVIHTTLKRLENQKEATAVQEDGVTLYQRAVDESEIPF